MGSCLEKVDNSKDSWRGGFPRPSWDVRSWAVRGIQQQNNDISLRIVDPYLLEEIPNSLDGARIRTERSRVLFIADHSISYGVAFLNAVMQLSRTGSKGHMFLNNGVERPYCPRSVRLSANFTFKIGVIDLRAPTLLSPVRWCLITVGVSGPTTSLTKLLQ